jgi:hypothetical protein
MSTGRRIGVLLLSAEFGLFPLGNLGPPAYDIEILEF